MIQRLKNTLTWLMSVHSTHDLVLHYRLCMGIHPFGFEQIVGLSAGGKQLSSGEPQKEIYDAQMIHRDESEVPQRPWISHYQHCHVDDNSHFLTCDVEESRRGMKTMTICELKLLFWTALCTLAKRQ